MLTLLRARRYNHDTSSPSSDMNPEPKTSPDESTFLEFRRKVQASELLSAAVDNLLRQLRFSGRLSIVLQNGRVLKSGYEEGYFRRRDDLRLIT